MLKTTQGLLLSGLIFALSACGGGGTSSPTPQSTSLNTDFNTSLSAMSAISDSMNTSAVIATNSQPKQWLAQFIDKSTDLLFRAAHAAGLNASLCSVQGTPNAIDNNFAVHTAFCKFAAPATSPETVRYSLAFSGGLICLGEKAGLKYDGSTQAIDQAISTACFPQSMVDHLKNVDNITRFTSSNVKTEKNPSWATGFDYGMTVTDAGAKIAFNLAKDHNGQFSFKDGGEQDAVSVAYNTTTGVLHYEFWGKQMSGNTLNWARHIKARAQLNLNSDGSIDKTKLPSTFVIGVGEYWGSSSDRLVVAEKTQSSTPLQASYYGGVNLDIDATKTKCLVQSGTCTAATVAKPSGFMPSAATDIAAKFNAYSATPSWTGL